jgi:hypothetical protein
MLEWKSRLLILLIIAAAVAAAVFGDLSSLLHNHGW